MIINLISIAIYLNNICFWLLMCYAINLKSSFRLIYTLRSASTDRNDAWEFFIHSFFANWSEGGCVNFAFRFWKTINNNNISNIKLI